MVNCSKCNIELETLFELDNINYFHCKECHINLRECVGLVTEINKIVSVDEKGKTTNITPGYSPLKRSQSGQNNTTSKKLECFFCKKIKSMGEEYGQILYTQLFLDDF